MQLTMMLLKLNHSLQVVILLLLCRSPLVVTAIEPGCENCGCCVDKVCAGARVQSTWQNSVCTYGCIAGIGGNRCYNKCPDECVTCEQTNYTNCATCEDGKYVNGKRRCVDCPKQCVGLCNSTTGNCESCKGHFHGNLCNECSFGYYGENCDRTCPKKCSLCHRINGTCVACNVNYAGPTCDGCVTGMYGQNCDLSCPSMKCFNKKCNRETGNCISCPDGYYGFGCGLGSVLITKYINKCFIHLHLHK